VTTDDTTAPDPVLRWAATAAHARVEHGTRWAIDAAPGHNGRPRPPRRIR
jgi:hypothetical protein